MFIVLFYKPESALCKNIVSTCCKYDIFVVLICFGTKCAHSVLVGVKIYMVVLCWQKC